MNDNKIAYCGLFCQACQVFLETANNQLFDLSQETQIPINLLKCKGCRSSCTSLFCRNCTIKKCCIQKGFFSCADCNEFPCSVLKAFENDGYHHHKGVIKSLKTLKDKGMDEWINYQNNRWSCLNCGNPYSWYDKNCRYCNGNVNGLKR